LGFTGLRDAKLLSLKQERKRESERERDRGDNPRSGTERNDDFPTVIKSFQCIVDWVGWRWDDLSPQVTGVLFQRKYEYIPVQ